MFALFFYFLEYVTELKDIFEEKKICWLTKIGREQLWMFGVCVFCAMVTCRSVFLCRTTNAVSDEWCVLKNNDFLYSHFVSFYFFVIFVTSPEICVGKCCGMVCGNKKTYAMASDLNRCCHMSGV